MGIAENGWRRLLPVLLVALGACRTDYQVRRENIVEQLPWLQPGMTLQTDIVQRLGEPARQVESGHILIWTLEDDLRPSKKTTFSNWFLHDFQRVGPLSLVVVLDDSRCVERASLVRLW
jgi:hypothetical protein